MSKIAEAYVEISAKMDKMERELAEARKKFSDSTAAMQKNADNLGTGMTSLYDKAMKVKLAYFAVAGAIGAVVGGIASAITSTADYLDGIDEMSTKTGVSVEMLTSLDLAAKKNGVSLDQLATSIRMMYRSMNEANEGTKEAADVYKRLGVNVLDASGKLKSGNDAFLEVADAIAKIENPAERSASAMKVFGRAGAEMLPMLEGGKEALRGYIEEAKRLGLVFTAEDARRAAEFNDQLDAFTARLNALKMTIGGKFIPDLTNLMKLLNGDITEGRSRDEKLKGGIGTFIEFLNRIGSFKNWNAISALGGAIGDVEKNLGPTNAELEKMNAELEAINKKKTTFDMTVSAKRYTAPVKTGPAPLAESMGRADAVAWAQNLQYQIDLGREGIDEFVKSFGDLTAGFEDAGEQVQSKFFEPFAAALGDLQSQWGSTIADFIKGGASFSEFMAGMFENVLDSFSNMMGQMAAQWLANQMFGGLLGSLGGSPSGLPGVQVGALQARAGTSIVINAIDTQSFTDALARNSDGVMSVVNQARVYGRAN